MNFCLVYLSGTAMLTSLSNWQIRGTWADIGMSVLSIICFAYYWKKPENLMADDEKWPQMRSIWNAIKNDSRRKKNAA